MRVATLTLLVLFASTPLAADFTVPPPYEWRVVPCATWNCAVAELMRAAGDPYVIAMPTTNTEFPWIVLERVPAGSVSAPESEPWVVEHFTVLAEATSRYAALDSEHCPLMITTTAGGFLVASRTPTRRRAAPH